MHDLQTSTISILISCAFGSLSQNENGGEQARRLYLTENALSYASGFALCSDAAPQ